MNIIRHELRKNLKPLLIWTVSIILLVSGASVELETLQKESFDIAEIMKAFPESMYKALSFDLISFNTPDGFFSYIGEYLSMLGALYAVLAGTNILSKELRKKTSEILFSMPAARNRIIRNKLIASGFYCFVLSLCLYVATLGSFIRFEPDPEFFVRLPLFYLYLFVVMIFFLTGGLFISAVSTNHKKTGAIGSGIVIGLYMLTFLVGLHEDFQPLKYFTPFEYFSAIDVMRGEPVGLYSYIITIGGIVLFYLVSMRIIKRKDFFC